MVQPQFKENTVVIIDTGKRAIRAGRGLNELLPAPTVNVQARVALRRSDVAKYRDGSIAMDMSDGPSSSSTPVAPKGLRPSNYLVGHKIDEALTAGEDLLIWWPFEDGYIRDWVQAEALWKYTIFYCLQLRRTLNEFPVLLSLPKPLSHPSYELLAQLFFERFNVAAFSINDRPVLQLFAANAITGVVLDVDDYATDITCILEGALIHQNTSITIPVGLSDCLGHLATVLASIPHIAAALPQEDQPTTMLRLANHLFKEGLIAPPSTVVVQATLPTAGGDDDNDLAAIIVAGKEKALIEANSKKKTAAARGAAEKEKEAQRLALDLVDVEFEGVKLTLGKERHRMCEPLLDSDLLNSWVRQGLKDDVTCMTLAQGVDFVTKEVDVQQRAAVWEAIQVTGKLGPMKAFGPALSTTLAPFVVRDPAEFGVAPNGQPFMTDQPKAFRIARVPEYFANYRDTGDELAAFLGASILGKLTFNDPMGRFLSKTEYSSKGPSAIAEYL